MIYNFWTDGAATMKKDDSGNYIREAGGWAWALVCDNNSILLTNTLFRHLHPQITNKEYK